MKSLKNRNFFDLNLCSNCQIKIINNNNFFCGECQCILCENCIIHHFQIFHNNNIFSLISLIKFPELISILKEKIIEFKLNLLSNNNYINKIEVENYLKNIDLKFNEIENKNFLSLNNLNSYYNLLKTINFTKKEDILSKKTKNLLSNLIPFNLNFNTNENILKFINEQKGPLNEILPNFKLIETEMLKKKENKKNFFYFNVKFENNKFSVKINNIFLGEFNDKILAAIYSDYYKLYQRNIENKLNKFNFIYSDEFLSKLLTKFDFDDIKFLFKINEILL